MITDSRSSVALWSHMVKLWACKTSLLCTLEVFPWGNPPSQSWNTAIWGSFLGGDEHLQNPPHFVFRKPKEPGFKPSAISLSLSLKNKHLFVPKLGTLLHLAQVHQGWCLRSGRPDKPMGFPFEPRGHQGDPILVSKLVTLSLATVLPAVKIQKINDLIVGPNIHYSQAHQCKFNETLRFWYSFLMPRLLVASDVFLGGAQSWCF